jgi:hypothetical protein
MAENRIITRHGPPSLHYQDWGASFSPCGTYRYSLWRTWNTSLRRICWVMLNPSTADEANNDPTNMRCETRGRRLGYGGHVFVNCFAFRSPNPDDLLKADDPVGPACDDVLIAHAEAADTVIAGWGTKAVLLDRERQVLDLLLSHGITVHALHLTKDRRPAHPLYLHNSLQPFVWQQGTDA